MTFINKSFDSAGKLKILSQDSQYDLACACATQPDEHRRRSKEDKWIYPVALPNGGYTFLFKTLVSNECINNCRYCPLRRGVDARRCTIFPDELSKTFLSYYTKARVSGLFLSSGVRGNPDNTMELINQTALKLRRAKFRGYIHLKIIPGASDGAIRQSLALASAVSLNVEAPREDSFKILSDTKHYRPDIIRPMWLISRLRKESAYHRKIKQTTQFVVGAAGETDREIVSSSWSLYRDLGLNRVYFSAYQRGAGSPELPGERNATTNRQILSREHRLYQADWLIRKYGFSFEDIPFGPGGNLSLTTDPKEAWARAHPEYFPVNVNKDEKMRLLRVPGLGEITVQRIINFRKNTKLRSLKDLGRENKLLKKAREYIIFD